MLGWLLLGVLVGAVILTITVGHLDRYLAQRKLRDNNILKGVVKDIVFSSGVSHIKLDALNESGEEQQVVFEADSYDASEIRVGTTIYA